MAASREEKGRLITELAASAGYDRKHAGRVLRGGCRAAIRARIASPIATCKMNGVAPFAYLKTTLERLAAGHPHGRLDELPPWRFEGGAGGVAG